MVAPLPIYKSIVVVFHRKFDDTYFSPPFSKPLTKGAANQRACTATRPRRAARTVFQSTRRRVGSNWSDLHMSILQRIVVPVVTPEDAQETCEAVQPHLDEVGTVIAVHVIEKAGGAIDKAPLAKREEDAEEILGVVEDRLRDKVAVDTRVVYDTDVVDGIFEAAEDADATSVVFVSREGGRLIRLLSGDTATRIVSEATIPVVALPDGEGEDE
jgi:nucleotide-binding universal stress UspA family protein